MDANRLNPNDGNEWEEISFEKLRDMVAVNDLEGRPIVDYELLLDIPALIKHYIETSVDEYEMEVIIGQCVNRIYGLRAERSNPGRAIEWDVLGDK